jgi:histidyl-tRNA synthetase
MSFQLPKGTFDILPYGSDEPWQKSSLWHYIESVIASLCRDYGYLEIRTPIYENTALFQRGVGEGTDIVTKEMFTFEDKGQRSLTLRPEGTASTVRSLIEHRLAQVNQVQKLYYVGPMFRHERPQSGRYRQFHQFGIEAIGSGSIEQDAEVIDLLYQFFHRLGIKGLKVHLNTVGDPASRAAYRDALLSFLRPHLASLSEESRQRFEKNPLRILDSKDPKDKEIIKTGPSILHHLSPPAKERFQALCHLLDQIHTPYEVDDKIVRGLDYYNHTVFEVISSDLGAQNTIGGGGRYDGLFAQFDGPDVPGIGFAAGLERVIQTLLAQQLIPPESSPPFVYFIPLGDEAKQKCFSLATLCRHNKVPSQIEMVARKPGPAIQNATKLGATYCVLIGAEELSKNVAQLKHLESRTQQEVGFDQILPTLKALLHA